MWKILWAVLGFAMFLIGIGGVRGDLDQWKDWLGVDLTSPDPWWWLLIAFGVALLVANLVPQKRWTRLIGWLPHRLREAVVRPQGNQLSAFYTTRTSLNELRGGIAKEVEDAAVIYAAWPGASVVAATLTQGQSAKVKRLLLRNPDNAEVPTYAEMAGWRLDKVKADIEHATVFFRNAGTDVKWLDAPLPTITIGDPDTKNAWARAEVVMFAESDNWQNYLIRRRDNKRAYTEIYSAFNRMWDSRWASAPPSSLSTSDREGSQTE